MYVLKVAATRGGYCYVSSRAGDTGCRRLPLRHWLCAHRLPPCAATACWSLDQHLRPTFEQLLTKLQDISRSAFMSFPRESFYNMQENWKTEIDEVLRDIRHREKVSRCKVDP